MLQEDVGSLWVPVNLVVTYHVFGLYDIYYLDF